MPGAELVGLRYERPFDDLAPPPGADGWRVVAGDFVTTEEGTGIVHLAPAFGEIDRQVGRAAGLPTLNPVGPDGRFTDRRRLAGRRGGAARPTRRSTTSSRPGDSWCGACPTSTPIRTAGGAGRRSSTGASPAGTWRPRPRKDQLLAANQHIDWHPEHIRDGRFGEWLSNNVDWALSRDRYWGTPLPIWKCPEGHATCVASLAELSELCGRDVGSVDPHRPAVDEVTFACPECRAADPGAPPASLPVARRVEAVIDAWFDSGSMPSAQVGYPHVAGSAEAFVGTADFITEAIDQTRGWFYSLLAVNELVFDEAPYRHVMCLGHIVDADGRKMSKSIGNVIDPWEILDGRGADPLRWWMYSQGSPWTPTRVSLPAIDHSIRETLLTLWNTLYFFTTYAALNGFDPADPAVHDPADRPPLDRWALSRLASTATAVTDALDAYEPLAAATAIASLVDDISNWYVRRSRRRFWRTDPGADPADTLDAQATLHHVLVSVAALLAPLCPFLADRLWRELTGAAPEDSVHLGAWPISAGASGDVGGAVDLVDTSLADAGLEDQMALARRLTSLGRAARSEAGVRVRQPLARALVYLPPGTPPVLFSMVAEELNVDQVQVTDELGEVLRFELVPNFKTLGPRLGPAVKEVKPALAGLDGAAAAAALEAGETVTVELSVGPVALGAGDLDLRVQGQPGYAVSRDGGEVVALDLAIDEDLRLRGLAREVVRNVQDLRKASGLEVADRIHLTLEGIDELAPYVELVGREVLAATVSSGGRPVAGAATATFELEGYSGEVRASIVKA